MCRGIMILGSPGAGKTTLGKVIAKQLDMTMIDIDAYIWNFEVISDAFMKITDDDILLK